MLELDDGRCIYESNAILDYLSYRSDFAPEDAFGRAKVLQWLFFEQHSHEPYIADARFISKFLGLPDTRREEYNSKQAGGHKALKIMENHLAKADYLVGDQLSIADVSLYGYTHVAHEGGFNLSEYPAIEQWIGRIQGHEGYVGVV